MSDDSYWVQFLLDGKPPVRSVVDRCVAEGLNTTDDGSVARCSRYTVDGERISHDDGGEDLDTVVDEISSARMGSLRFWDGTGMALTLAFSNVEEQDWNAPRVILKFTTGALDPEVASEELVSERVDTIIAATTWIAEDTAPEYAWGSLRVAGDPDAGVKPTDTPIGESVTELSWITVISPDVTEEFGGRAFVLDGPAWRTEELSSGHLLVVDRPHPRRGHESKSMTAHVNRSG